MSRLIGYVRGAQGSSAVEFALVLPLFLALVFGMINLAALLFAAVNLHNATEDAARCWSVKTTVCTSTASTRSYALGRYKGPGVGVDFPIATITKTGACHSTAGTADGHSVTGSASWKLTALLVHVTVPITATACFP